MMGLAFQAVNRTIARWAAVWLQEQCGVQVTLAEDEENGDAAPPEAANLR